MNIFKNKQKNMLSMGNNKFIVLIISIILGIFATFLIHLYVKNRIAVISGGELIPLIFAAEDISSGANITEDMLAIRKVPKAYIHFQAIENNYKSFILSQKTCVDIKKGDAVLWTDIYIEEMASLEQKLKPNERAIAVHIDDVSGINGLIKPGNRVDVLVSFSPPSKDFQSTKFITKVLLQGVDVLAVGREMTSREYSFERNIRSKKKGLTESINPVSSSFEKASVITLKLSLRDAAALAVAEQKGTIRLVLRSREDVIIQDIDSISCVDVLLNGMELSQKPQKEQGYPIIHEQGVNKGSAYQPCGDFRKKTVPILQGMKEKIKKDMEKRIKDTELKKDEK